jgi:hypothetical protein
MPDASAANRNSVLSPSERYSVADGRQGEKRRRELESREPKTGSLRFIEGKGRAADAEGLS